MAVIHRYTLVLSGVSVVRDGVAGTLGVGRDAAKRLTSADLFTARRQSQRRYPQAEHEPGPRPDHAGDPGAADAADGAGRPGCGVLASRSPALPAGRTLRRGRSLAAEGVCRSLAWRLGRFTTGPTATAGRMPSGRPNALRAMAPRPGDRTGLPRGETARGHVTASRAGLKPAGGALAASTRG